jgi:hypothetical protein
LEHDGPRIRSVEVPSEQRMNDMGKLIEEMTREA